MSGTVIRRGHQCGPIAEGDLGIGAVWRCDCGRRWRAGYREFGDGKLMWRRRVWPWPR